MELRENPVWCITSGSLRKRSLDMVYPPDFSFMPYCPNSNIYVLQQDTFRYNVLIMRFLLGFDSRWFIELLNGRYSENDAAPANALREFFPELANFQTWQPVPLPATQENIASCLIIARENRPLELRQHSADLPAVAGVLRSYVDEWIGSGYSNGVEEPMSRRLPGRNSTLNRTLTQFLEQYPVQLWAENAGFIVAQFPAAPRDNARWANYEAHRLMLAFIDSDLKHSIAKCLKCGVYFERKRVQPSYKRGAYCEKHIAVAAIEGKRAKDAALKYGAFMAALQEWESLKRKPREDMKRWLVQRINKKLFASGDQISLRGVTGFLREIQQHAAVQTAPTSNPAPDSDSQTTLEVPSHSPYSSLHINKDFVEGVALWRHKDALAILKELPTKLSIRYVTQEEFEGFPYYWTVNLPGDSYARQREARDNRRRGFRLNVALAALVSAGRIKIKR